MPGFLKRPKRASEEGRRSEPGRSRGAQYYLDINSWACSVVGGTVRSREPAISAMRNARSLAVKQVGRK